MCSGHATPAFAPPAPAGANQRGASRSPRHPSRRPTAIAYAAATALATTATLLTACGGGGGSTTDVVPEVSITPVIPPVSFTGTVADGPLSGAIVCQDLNNNSRCEISEPRSAPTDANGRYSLTVSSLDAGKHAVIAEVPATAIDKDTGAEVGTALTLMSPATGQAADLAVFVSPMTSLVQAQIDATGSSLAGATAFCQAQAGLTVSPLVDFTAPAPASEGRASGGRGGPPGHADLGGADRSRVRCGGRCRPERIHHLGLRRAWHRCPGGAWPVAGRGHRRR